MTRYHDVTFDQGMVEAAIDYATPILAKQSKRHPLWVRRRMIEQIDQARRGEGLGELAAIALGLAMEAGKRGIGVFSETVVETGEVIPLRRA